MSKAVFALSALLLLNAARAVDGQQCLRASSGPAGAAEIVIAERYGKLPLSFEANAGQVDSAVRFLSRGQGYVLFLTAREAVLSLTGTQGPAVVAMSLAGGKLDPHVMGERPQPTTSNYLVGNDPSRWHIGMANYGQVRYSGVYPGIDLVYYGSQRQLEYDFVVAPGADPTVIRWVFRGADRISLGPRGELILHVAKNQLVHRPPIVYQELSGERRRVEGRYVLRGGGQGKAGEVSFQIGRYDRTRALVIDPVLGFSTLLGGSSVDSGRAIAVDSNQNVYVTGSTRSANSFPGLSITSVSTAPVPDDPDPEDVFVTKINAAGTAIVYSTLLGGSEIDTGTGIAVDSEGNAYVTGFTGSRSFTGIHPGTGSTSIQRTLRGLQDAFVTKINPRGTQVVYSTYLGGDGDDAANAIAVDSSRNAYVAGRTNSSTLPGVREGLIQHTFGGGGSDAFLTKIDREGRRIEFSTFLGGADADEAMDIAEGSSAEVVIVGHTKSSNFPVTDGSIQRTHGGFFDAFVTKIDSRGSGIVYATFLGGNAFDSAEGVAIDSAGNAYVTGATSSEKFPGVTRESIQPTIGGLGGSVEDAFVTKINPSGTGFEYSTFLGGGHLDRGFAIGVDPEGAAYIAGSTLSRDFPVTPGAIQPTFGFDIVRSDFMDVFVTKINPKGTALAYSTYLGGAGTEGGLAGIAVDVEGNAYITATTTGSHTFPGATPDSIQAAVSGIADVFVTKIQSHAGHHWTAVASTGTVDESAEAIYAFDGAALGYLPGSGSVDAIVARYNVTNTSNTAITQWDTLELGYSDNAPGSFVAATLIQVDRCTGAQTRVCTAGSVDAGDRACATCTFLTPINFDQFLYYVEVTLKRGVLSLNPQVLSLRLF